MEKAGRGKIIFLDTVSSTNDFASELIRQEHPPEMTVVAANQQTSGKGRKQRDWHSASGLNLTFSVILYPGFLESGKQFYLSIIASLAVVRMLDRFCKGISVKWPNDIYLWDDKIAGILIENVILGSNMDISVTGIGININEDPMPVGLGAISLKQATGKEYSLRVLLHDFLSGFRDLYNDLKNGKGEALKKAYESRLYFRGKTSVFEMKDMVIRAYVKGINDYGQLILILPDGSNLACSMDEITWKQFI